MGPRMRYSWYGDFRCLRIGGGGESWRSTACQPPAAELGGGWGWGGSARALDVMGWSLLWLGRKVCKSSQEGKPSQEKALNRGWRWLRVRARRGPQQHPAALRFT